MSPENKILVILSQNFLATSNTFINCMNGKMKMTFRNMTIELNVLTSKTNPWGLMTFNTPILIGWVTFSWEE